jgi:hypothetical protein
VSKKSVKVDDYIRFAYDPHQNGNTTVFCGWVDKVESSERYWGWHVVAIQVDDKHSGNRAVNIRKRDVLEILPFKIRPLVYYRRVLCTTCIVVRSTCGEAIWKGCPYITEMTLAGAERFFE